VEVNQRNQDAHSLLIEVDITPPTLTTRELSVRKMGKPVLSDLSAEFSTGVTALLGPNGAGKTTLLNALARPWTVRSGSIELVDDHEVTLRDHPRVWNARVGLMPQSPQFFSGFSALESVSYSAWLKGASSAQSRQAAAKSLGLVDLGDLSGVKVRRLSGGQQRRVAFAQAIAHDPTILLLDEPTVGLDPEQRQRFHEAIRKADDHITIVSTHLVQDVIAIAERVIIIADGRVCFSGPVSELSAKRRDQETAESAVEREYLRIVRASRLD
jgi:ABC-2 type transport system ATP-binding protein